MKKEKLRTATEIINDLTLVEVMELERFFKRRIKWRGASIIGVFEEKPKKKKKDSDNV